MSSIKQQPTKSTQQPVLEVKPNEPSTDVSGDMEMQIQDPFEKLMASVARTASEDGITMAEANTFLRELFGDTSDPETQTDRRAAMAKLYKAKKVLESLCMQAAPYVV